jgi:hypothetical protein
VTPSGWIPRPRKYRFFEERIDFTHPLLKAT